MNAKALLVVALSSLALGIAGCSTESDGPSTVVVEPNEPLATLTLRWTIDGTTDPATCHQSGSDVIDISILDPSSNGEIQAFQQTCETFETSITLAPGAYKARARLVASDGTARTTDVPVREFVLNGNDELVQDVDFPADSFF